MVHAPALPILASTPLVAQVADALRSAILTGSLRPGERLSVPDVARRLGVSRTPAREAMLILERDGLIQTRPRLGAEVVSYGNADLVEMLELREMLDGLAARLAAERMSRADRAELDRLAAAHAAALEASDRDRHVELDLAFHHHLRDGAGNRRLGKSLLELERQIRMLLKSTASSPGFSARATIRDHRAIARAVVAGDADAAEAAARAHVRRVKGFCSVLAASEGPADKTRPAVRRQARQAPDAA